MLRIILWKIGFEWANLKRIVWPRAEHKIYYFSFGANLSAEVLTRRRIHVYEAFDYILENAALRFSQSGFYKDHGYASADTVEGQVVYGRMYLIGQTDAARMDYFEGVPFLRVHEKIFRKVGKVNEAGFFYYRATRVQDGLKPTREYLDYLTTAYNEMPGVPQEHIDNLAATEVLDQYLPQDQTGEYVRNIQRWPAFAHPMLVYYEGCCLRLVHFLWNRSLFQWLIKPQGLTGSGD